MNACARVFLVTAFISLFCAEASYAQTYTVGDTVCFTVAAIDMQGDTIRDWDQTGSACTLTLEHSTANADTSTMSWNADPDGYTWALLLHNGTPLQHIPPALWMLPNTIFVDGKVELCLIQTSADADVQFSLCPALRSVKTNAGPLTFEPGPLDRILVDLTPSLAWRDAVYLLREYEVMVIPQDLYGNTVPTALTGKFTSPWESEFAYDPAVDHFNGTLDVAGATNFFFTSTKARTVSDPLTLGFEVDGTSATGLSDPFEVLRHAPEQFYLQSPLEGTIIDVADTNGQAVFRWDEAFDPYRNINISRLSGRIGTDTVGYQVTFYARHQQHMKFTYDADSNGTRNRLTLPLSEIENLATNLCCIPLDVIWTVEASDGDYQTIGSVHDTLYQIPAMMFRVTKEGSSPVESLPYVPTGLILHQNYPNPVSTGEETAIRFETNRHAHVLLTVYDLLGNEVAVLADEALAPGIYSAQFNTARLSPGVYVYKLNAGGTISTKSMVVTK